MDVQDQVIYKLENGIKLRDETVEKRVNHFESFSNNLDSLNQSNNQLNNELNQLLTNYNNFDKQSSLELSYKELEQLKAYNVWLLDLIHFSSLLDDLVLSYSYDKYKAVRAAELELLQKHQNSHYIGNLKQNSLNKIKDSLFNKLGDDISLFGYPNQEINPINLNEHTSFVENLRNLDNFDRQTSEIDESDYKCLVMHALVSPIQLRFIYHFESNAHTNKLNKPEFYLNFISDNITRHTRFISSEIRYLLPQVDTLHCFITLLADLARSKLVKSIPSLMNISNTLTHTIHQCLEFDHFVNSQVPHDSPPISITNSFLDNADWFNGWVEAETKLANDTLQVIISSPDAWSFIRKPVDDNDSDSDSDHDAAAAAAASKPAFNCTVSAQRILELIETVTERYKPLPLLQQRATFLIRVQLPLIEKYGSKLTMSLDAFESYSSTFIAAMSNVPGSFSEKHKANQDDSLGSSTLTKLIKIITNSEYFAQKMTEWGEDTFFLELWQHFTKLSSSQDKEEDAFDKTLFSELATMFTKLAERAQSILVSHSTSSIMLSFNDYLKSQLWNVDMQAGKDDYNQDLAKSYSIMKHHLSVIDEQLIVNSRVFTKRLIKRISETLMGSIKDSIFEMHQQFSQSSSQHLLNIVLQFTRLNTPQLHLTFAAFIPLIDRLVLLSLPSKALDEEFKDRVLSKAMQYAWEDDATHYDRWCRHVQLNDLSLVGCVGDFDKRPFTVGHVEAQGILRKRVECWR